MSLQIPDRLPTVDPPGTTVVVAAGQDRFGSALRLSGWRFDCKVSAKDTGGAYCIYDTVRTARGGPPMHVHHRQDEWFFVRHGEFTFEIGGHAFRLGPGDSLLGPKGVPHAFAGLCDNGALTIAFVPAGTIEQLFNEVSEINRLREPSMQDWCTISRAHDVEIVGPPLTIRSSEVTSELK